MIELRDLDTIQIDPRNAKAHDTAGIRASLRRFGFADPLVIDARTDQLIAGHGRLAALHAIAAEGGAPPAGVEQTNGTFLVPCYTGWSSADDTEAEAALLALNRLTERGGWDDAALAETLQHLADLGSLDDAVGFGDDDLAELRAKLALLDVPDVEADPDAALDPDEIEVRAQLGDLWTLGTHRILVGDARDPASWKQLLDGTEAHLIFTSPPYADRRKYDETTEFTPIKPDAYVTWWEPLQAAAAAHLAADGSFFVNIKPSVTPDNVSTELYVFDLVLAHVRTWGWHFVTELCWERGGIPGNVSRRFKNQFEPIYQFSRAELPKMRPDAVRRASDHVPFNLQPGDGLYGSPEDWQGQKASARKHRTGSADNVGHALQGQGASVGSHHHPGLAYPGNRLPAFAGSHEAVGHTAAFPVGLPRFFCDAYTDPGDTVIDPFVGSGSTILAAELTGRDGYGIELSPRYVDMAVARWERLTGEVATVER